MTHDRFNFLWRNFHVSTPIPSDYDIDVNDGNGDTKNKLYLVEHLVEAKIDHIHGEQKKNQKILTKIKMEFHLDSQKQFGFIRSRR